MKPKGILLSIYLTILYPPWISEGKDLPTGPRTIEHAGDVELNFFQRIQTLNLDWQDILGSYQNVSAEVETAMCKSRCKTTVALWVLQSLKPCDLIQKADCPRGLVCCISGATDYGDDLERYTPKPKDSAYQEISEDGHDHDHDNVYYNDGYNRTSSIAFVPYYDENEQIYYPEPILDPIPNDESSEILKV